MKATQITPEEHQKRYACAENTTVKVLKLKVEKHVVVMKNNMVFFIEPVTAAKLSLELVKQEKHQFIFLKELGCPVNTAEMEYVLNPEQYEVHKRIQNGEWLCRYQKFHKKSQSCDCAEEIRKNHEMRKRMQEQQELYAPMTSEERKKMVQLLHKYKI